MDITHSLQQPNGADGVSGGLPGLISTIAKSGLAAGADGIFMETHRNPVIAKSDGANMLPFRKRLVFSRILPLSGVPLMK